MLPNVPPKCGLGGTGNVEPPVPNGDRAGGVESLLHRPVPRRLRRGDPRAGEDPAARGGSWGELACDCRHGVTSRLAWRMMTPVRADLPSGTVTFLFTDVEGSTKLLHELGAEAYAEALAEHRRVIREACAAEGGVEVDTQGDAFFFAFPTAPGALAAAEAITEALRWGRSTCGSAHTGTPLAHRGGTSAAMSTGPPASRRGPRRQVLVSRPPPRSSRSSSWTSASTG